MPKTKAEKAIISTAKAFNEIHKEYKKISNKLNSFLEESCTYTDSNNKKWHVEGVKQKKDNNGNIVSYGYCDVFWDNFNGRPFIDLGRDLSDFFRLYCLSKGMSEKKILSLANDNISKDLANELREYKNQFMNMLFKYPQSTKDITDYYLFIANEIEKDKDMLTNVDLFDAKKIKQSKNLFIKYAGSQAYLEQAFGKSDSATGDTKIMIDSINSALKESGKDYEYDMLVTPVFPFSCAINCIESLNIKLEEDALGKDDFSTNEIQVVSANIGHTYAASMGYKYLLKENQSKGGSWIKNAYSPAPHTEGPAENAPITINCEELYSFFEKEFSTSEVVKAEVEVESTEYYYNKMLPDINRFINEFEASGKASYRNSNYSGLLYKDLLALKNCIIEINNPDSRQVAKKDYENILQDLKIHADMYLIHKANDGSYNKNSYGKIAVADAVIKLCDSYKKKTLPDFSNFSSKKAAVDAIISKKKANGKRTYRTQLSYISLLKDEINKEKNYENSILAPVDESCKQIQKDLNAVLRTITGKSFINNIDAVLLNKQIDSLNSSVNKSLNAANIPYNDTSYNAYNTTGKQHSHLAAARKLLIINNKCSMLSTNNGYFRLTITHDLNKAIHPFKALLNLNHTTPLVVGGNSNNSSAKKQHNVNSSCIAFNK